MQRREDKKGPIPCWLVAFCILPAFSHSEAQSASRPRSYKEAYSMAFEAIQINPKEAIRIIKEVHSRNIPVRPEDTFYVASIASLALRPAFREFAIGKELLQRVVAVKANDYRSISMLFFLSVIENNLPHAEKYANNLLTGDYEGYIRQMEPASQGTIPYIRDYLKGVVDLYQALYTFFLSQEKENQAKKAKAIANQVETRILKK
jgi:hypothetical protein